MARVFRCPNCQAPLKPESSAFVVVCAYCHASVDLQRSKPAVAGRGSSGASKRVPLALGVILGLGILGGVLFLMLLRGPQPAPSSTAAAASASSSPAETPQPPSAPGAMATAPAQQKKTRLQSLLSLVDVNDDQLADVVYANCRPSGEDKLARCQVGVLSGQDGATLWEKDYLSDTRGDASRVSGDGVVIVQDNTRSIVAYELKSGAQRWRLTLSDFLSGAPRFAPLQPQICLFYTSDRALTAVHTHQGKILWRKDLDTAVNLTRTMTTSSFGLVQLGDDALFLPRANKGFQLTTGKPLAMPKVNKKKRGRHRRSFVTHWIAVKLAGGVAYYRPVGKSFLVAFDLKRGKRAGRIRLPSSEGVQTFPLADRLLASAEGDDGRPLLLIQGKKTLGRARIGAHETITHAEMRGDRLLLLTRTTRGTRRTTLYGFDGALEHPWSVQLDDSGKRFVVSEAGSNWRGFGSPGGAETIAFGPHQIAVESCHPAQPGGTFQLRALDSGDIEAEVTVPPPAGSNGPHCLSKIVLGKSRYFIVYARGGLIALDANSHKPVWRYNYRS